jgi:hypothetical protein
MTIITMKTPNTPECSDPKSGTGVGPMNRKKKEIKPQIANTVILLVGRRRLKLPAHGLKALSDLFSVSNDLALFVGKFCE